MEFSFDPNSYTPGNIPKRIKPVHTNIYIGMFIAVFFILVKK